jgi:AmmeMemoRadiSam system protein B
MSVVDTDADLFAEEHGITIHIPFIARYFPNASVVQMVLKSDIPDIVLLMLKNYMIGEMRESDMIILSMDLSHYKTPEAMAAEDGYVRLAIKGTNVNLRPQPRAGGKAT